VVVGVSVWQPHFVAGSVPDLACELVLLPGKLFASMFRDRGTASPEFLWRSRTQPQYCSREFATSSCEEDGLGLILREVAQNVTLW